MKTPTSEAQTKSAYEANSRGIKNRGNKKGSNVMRKMLLLNLLADLLAVSSVNALSVPSKTSGIISQAQAADTEAINSTKRLGAIFPPGYPDAPYVYAVRYSDVKLVCFNIQYRPQMNMQRVEDLMRTLVNFFSDPGERDAPLSGGEWREPAVRIPGRRTTTLSLTSIPHLDSEMTYGLFLNVLIGINHIRLDYPHLTFNCLVHQGGSGLQTLGIVKLDDGSS